MSPDDYAASQHTTWLKYCCLTKIHKQNLVQICIYGKSVIYMVAVCHIYVLISSVLTLIFRKRWILENTDLQMTLQWTLG